jgi:hypothetical protein
VNPTTGTSTDAATTTAPALDHLVVVAATLDEGAAWCEATLGVTPGSGGEHPLMGTHNRLLSVASPQFPGAYLEIIAINPVANYAGRTSGKRWFDMDSDPLMQRVQHDGPQLVHWVARVPDLDTARTALTQLGLDAGPAVAASRATPEGLLQWRITIRPDGQRPMGGCLPTLIQWGEAHPTDRMPASGMRLRALALSHPLAPLLTQALDTLGLTPPAAPPPLAATPAPHPGLRALLDTPRGPVELRTPIF